MRRVLLLSYTKEINDKYLTGISEALLRNGHTVRRMFHCGGKTVDDEICQQWGNFDFSEIEAFNPERIVIFNGYAKETSGATNWLKVRYKMFFVERAWFPQEDNIYMDSIGLGGRSSLAKSDLTRSAASSKRVENTVNDLREKFYGPTGNGDYILLPFQLEQDTSVVLDSPFFKTMESLNNFVSRAFFDYEVHVTKHPLHGGLGNTASLARNAKAIIGINSTSMIEALVHHKPMGFLGNSIINASNIVCGPDFTLQFPRNILDRFKPDPLKMDYVIYNLLNKQFNQHEVPDNIIKQIEV